MPSNQNLAFSHKIPLVFHNGDARTSVVLEPSWRLLQYVFPACKREKINSIIVNNFNNFWQLKLFMSCYSSFFIYKLHVILLITFTFNTTQQMDILLLMYHTFFLLIYSDMIHQLCIDFFV